MTPFFQAVIFLSGLFYQNECCLHELIIKFGCNNFQSFIKSYLHYSEPELITRWQQGDEKAFDFLYRKYFLLLVNIAIKKVGSPEIAEELVQDIFLNVYIKRNTLLPDAELAPYLFTALKNRIYDYYRKKLSEKKYARSVNAKIYVVSGDDTHEQLEAKELHEQLYERLQEMPERRKEIFLMRQDGIPNKEIAERLNISINTVESQIHKALRFLKSSIVNFLFLFL